MKQMSLTIIVAMARNRVIGANGAMPWHLPADLARFRRLTMGRPMIMGRKTFESIGRQLDGRDSIVLSHGRDAIADGIIYASGIEAAMMSAHECARRRDSDEIMVIGGESVFRLFLPFADRIEMTLIETEPKGDTFFPAISSSEWALVSALPVPVDDADMPKARFLTFCRETHVNVKV